MFCIQDYLSACRKLELDEFRRSHGDAFLVHHGPGSALLRPMPGDATQRFEPTNSSSERALQPGADFLVFPVDAPQPGQPRLQMWWIGRSETNEVVVPDASVSEVHAFIRRDEAGYWVVDAGSRNGTRVDGRLVAVQGRGDPVLLRSGARVRLGAVKLTFLTADSFRSLVTRLLE